MRSLLLLGLSLTSACAADVQVEPAQVITEVEITPATQVGDPHIVNDPGPVVGVGQSPPNQCVEGPPDADTTGGMDIEAIALSRSHSCALLGNKTVRC